MSVEALPADLLERVVQAENVAWYDWFMDREKIRVSPAYAEMFDLDSDNVTTRTTYEFLHPDDLPAFRAAHVVFFKSQDTHLTVEYRFRQRGGAIRWARVRAMAERDAAGRVTRMTGTVADITETKEQEAQNRAYAARQEASIEVLKAISGSPDDTQPVFELIARRAAALCGATSLGMVEFDGTLMHARVMVRRDPEARRAWFASHPRAPGPETVTGRVILTGETLNIRDTRTDPLLQFGSHDAEVSRLGVPLLRDGRPIGAIVLARAEAGGFTAGETALVESFAEQAALAVVGAATLRELRERTAELAERNDAFAERIDHQAATIDVLKEMSASPGNAQPVFDLITQRARELCEATSGTLVEFDGELLHLRSQNGDEETVASGALETYRRAFPRSPTREFIVGMVVLERQLIHVRDGGAGSELSQASRSLLVGSGAALPLLRDDQVIGAIGITSKNPAGFSDSQIELLKTFAEQAVIAIGSAETYRALQERTAALAQRNSEFGERIEQQAATIDVLKVMSASPGDPQPVFDLIVERAQVVCEAWNAGLFEYDGSLVHIRALTRNYREPEDFEAYVRQYPMPLRTDPNNISVMAIADQRIHHVRDVTTESGVSEGARRLGVRSNVAIPMIREERAVGAIALVSQQTGGFSDSQIELLKAFAEQAVIAIASAETYRALQERTAQLTERNDSFAERIEQQSATIDVLKTMSSSPDDVQPIFQQIVARARELCGSQNVSLMEYDGDLLYFRAWSANENDVASVAGLRAFSGQFPMPPTRDSVSGRAVLEKRIVHVRDRNTASDFRQSPGLANRSQISIPLLRDGKAIGVINLASAEPGGYSDSQISLLETFAEQAVIAIGSTGTYRALQDRTAALAQRNSEFQEQVKHQAATIDVLKVMSASPGDAGSALQLIARGAWELCNATGALVLGWDGQQVHLMAYHRPDFTEAEAEAYRTGFPRPPADGSFWRQVIRDRKMIHIRNVDLEPAVTARLRDFGLKSYLWLPLVRDETVVGIIGIDARAPGGFSDSQVALLETFAEQAVIAIGSAETYRALQDRTTALARRNSEFGERIEQQAATIDVLKTMSSTPEDVQPVFELITRRAAELCESRVGLLEFDGTMIHLRAMHGYDDETTATFRKRFPTPLDPTSSLLFHRSISERKRLHLSNVALDPAVRTLGGTAVVTVPLMRDGLPIGVIGLNGSPPGGNGFSDSQIALLETFAEQAVIAIRSVATYRALRERTAELTRSVAELQALEEVLRAVNSSLDLETVLSTIISRAVRLSDADEGTIYEFDDAEDAFILKSTYGMSDDRVATLRDTRIRLGETHLGRAGQTRAPVHVPDVQADPTLSDNAKAALVGIHAVLAVPLLREDQVVGGLVIRRRTVGDFPPSIPTLLQTFAGQSVLAIENARLFQELAARGEEARRARIAAESALADLRRTQDRLLQTEKLASLGQLTAGIAHEIKNPLNFVNNFSDLSVDLLAELDEAVAPERLAIPEDLRAEIDDITSTLKSNLEKIAHHGRRADSIVKNMLLHSRTGASEHRVIALNPTVEEALNLAYHGERAKTPGFNITMESDLDPNAGEIDAYPQEISRVLLNLIGNGFYAAHKRAKEPGFEPTLKVSTRDMGDHVEIRVRDNGTGIPEAERERIFEPFFTTKPAGEGTGLGLSLSFDIIVKQHGGTLTVDSQLASFTEFRIVLPRRIAEVAVP